MRVAFIGSAGVPNRYGGFESFLEACAPMMALSRIVYVTCDCGRYRDRDRDWNGVRRLFLPVPANGGASIVHDVAAFLRVIWLADAIVVLGVSGGMFFPAMRLLCDLMGRRLIVNVDGVEWRRAKFGRGKRAFLRLSDTLAQWAAHRVVVDSAALLPFLTSAGRRKATCIAYSGDQVCRLAGQGKRDRILTICRIEPENNCHILLEAVAASGSTLHYDFVGNWTASDYGRALLARFEGHPTIHLHPPVYDERTIAAYRERCAIYLHGHSVGGTNPSLVEMLFYDCRIIAFDCAFNRETAGDAAAYFTDAKALLSLLREPSERVNMDRTGVRERYTRRHIVDRYFDVIDGRRESA